MIPHVRTSVLVENPLRLLMRLHLLLMCLHFRLHMLYLQLLELPSTHVRLCGYADARKTHLTHGLITYQIDLGTLNAYIGS